MRHEGRHARGIRHGTDNKGRIVDIEAKAGIAVGSSDAAGLKHLHETAGDKWLRGITPFAKDIHAVPVSALWEW